MKYQFIAQHRHEYAMTLMCRVLEVLVSGYSAWMKRPVSQHSREDAQLAQQVKTIFKPIAVWMAARVCLPNCKLKADQVCAEASSSSHAPTRTLCAAPPPSPDPHEK